MAAGGPGDAPWSDFFTHKIDVFPKDIAEMLWAIHRVSPSLIRHLNHPEMWDWEQGEKLNEARVTLKNIMQENDISLSKNT
jgi:hypothetical protein